MNAVTNIFGGSICGGLKYPTTRTVEMMEIREQRAGTKRSLQIPVLGMRMKLKSTCHWILI